MCYVFVHTRTILFSRQPKVEEHVRARSVTLRLQGLRQTSYALCLKCSSHVEELA